MITSMVLMPNTIKREERKVFQTNVLLPTTMAYVGAYTYCISMEINSGIEFDVKYGEVLHYNVQIGKYNSIAHNLSIILGKNHNIRNIDTGSLGLMFEEKNILVDSKEMFNQKGNVIIQNDVWIGENVTIMQNTIVRNGAVIAANSHVVSDVPPYAIVGGNPAKVIGYRFPKDLIAKLQVIRWWDWKEEKLLENASLFTEDVEGFCEKFFQEENRKYNAYCSKRNIESKKEDVWFAFVDYYENYASYPYILESFLDTFIRDERKKLILFVQDIDDEEAIADDIFMDIKNIVDKVANTPNIHCQISIERGGFEEAENKFLECQHYLISRTYWAVHFSCLADLLGIELVSGVDSKIQYHKYKNMVPLEEEIK